jgi:hypothetical protein
MKVIEGETHLGTSHLKNEKLIEKLTFVDGWNDFVRW